MTLSKVPRVLFVCRGNMERSQMAQGYYNHISGTQNATSAGVIDISDWYPRPPDSTIAIMKDEGIDISKHFVKQIKPEMLLGIHRIYVFCEPETCPWFLRLNAIQARYHHIDDPYEQPLPVVIKIRDTIHEFVNSLLLS